MRGIRALRQAVGVNATWYAYVREKLALSLPGTASPAFGAWTREDHGSLGTRTTWMQVR